jgi:hypothetical protein
MMSPPVFLTLLCAWQFKLSPATAIAPNMSLATVPTAYFGGNSIRRGDANIEMLSKMRIVMIEKWEGHGWVECLANGSSPSCLPSCGVENDILETLSRVKALNPGIATVLYWNTMLAFPFYTAVGTFMDADALTMDSETKKPLKIRNDNGMENIGECTVSLKLCIMERSSSANAALLSGLIRFKASLSTDPHICRPAISRS